MRTSRMQPPWGRDGKAPSRGMRNSARAGGRHRNRGAGGACYLVASGWAWQTFAMMSRTKSVLWAIVLIPLPRVWRLELMVLVLLKRKRRPRGCGRRVGTVGVPETMKATPYLELLD